MPAEFLVLLDGKVKTDAKNGAITRVQHILTFTPVFVIVRGGLHEVGGGGFDFLGCQTLRRHTQPQQSCGV